MYLAALHVGVEKVGHLHGAVEIDGGAVELARSKVAVAYIEQDGQLVGRFVVTPIIYI